MKDEGTDNEIWKARFIVQGRCDTMKKSLVHGTSAAGQHTAKTLVGLEAVFRFRVYSNDVMQAF